MTDYAAQRKAYVSQVRNSFGQESEQMCTPTACGKEGIWIRVRFGIALLLFVVFFYWQTNGSTIYGYTPAKVIDMIEDNRYDTILQECNIVLNNAIHEDIK